MRPYSVTRRLIATVLLLELLSALALTWLAVAFERHSRMRSFDISLRAHADTLIGAVGDADDQADNVVLDMRGVQLPGNDLYDVEGADGRVLGRSSSWPAQVIDQQLAQSIRDGIYRVTLDSHRYRFVVVHAVRIVDPGEKGGGIKRPIVVRYGASIEHVWPEVWKAVRFNALASLVLLTATGIGMTWFLRRSLAPLAELAEEASRISTQRWQFHPRESARAMIELSPLTIALEETLSRLQRSFEQQRQFTSNAAHELKTDLAIAKSSLQLLAMRRRSPEEYERGLEVCLTDTLRLERTVAEMLTLARVESAETPNSSREASTVSDLNLHLQNAVTQLASLAELNQVIVRIDAPHRTRVRMSEEDARLLCTNVLLNALQHSRPLTEVQASLRSSESRVTLTIRDQGHGISPQSIAHVFEPFYRGDASRDRRSGGTGLGLSICKGVCERAGGEIAICSELGEGTEVTVRVPAVVAEDAGAGQHLQAEMKVKE